MSDTTTTKRVSLNVEAQNNVGGGLAAVRADVKRTLDAIDRDAASRIQSSRAAIAAAQRVKEARGSRPMPGFLDSLDSQFGGRSDLKKTLDLLKGAGALAGLTMVASAAADVSAKLREAVVQIDAGEKSAGDMADALTRSLPILGNIYAAGRDIRAVLDGSAVAMARVNREASMIDATGKIIRSVLAESKQIVDAITMETARVKLDIDIEALKTLPEWLRENEARRLKLDAELKFDATQAEKDIEREAAKVMERHAAELAKITKIFQQPLPDRFIRVVDGKDAGEREVENPAYVAAQDERRIAKAARGRIEDAVDQARRDAEAAAREREAVKKQRFQAQTGVAFDAGRPGLDLKQQAIDAEQQAMEAERFRRTLDKLRSSAVAYIGDIAQRAVAHQREMEPARARTLESIRIDDLRTQAELGDQAAAVEAERLEINRKYLEQARELRDITNDQLAGYEQRAAAQAALATLEQRRADEVRAAARARARSTADALKSTAIVSLGAGDTAESFAMRERSASLMQAQAAQYLRAAGEQAVAAMLPDRQQPKLDLPPEVHAAAKQMKPMVDSLGKLVAALQAIANKRPLETIRTSR